MTTKLFSIGALFFIAGCSTTPLLGTSSDVREIDESEAKSCLFIQSFIVRTHNPLTDNPGRDAKDIAMNRTDLLRGNAFVVKNELFLPSPLNVGSIIELSGDAYQCQKKAGKP